MPRIQRLSQSLINKIAAGEVIERPASVVKELVENAVDAGATRIQVAATEGGVDSICVTDNGCGIESDELELALACHATSKIQEADDLFRIGTMGFRGEALASIAEVARVCIRSRTAQRTEGAQIEATGGRLGEVSPCGCPTGTTIEVRNLFFNMPVRRKGVRSAQAEFGHVKEALIRIALALPQIDFRLSHNGKTVLELSGTEGWRERIARTFGRDLAESLIWVEGDDGDLQLSGYVAHPSHSRANTKMQYLFCNGRYFRDRSLQHALGEAYRGLLLTGRFPIAFLNLALPPEQVDVNVHPTKIEVRFQDPGRLYSHLLSTLRTKFLSTDLHARVRSEEDVDPTGAHDEAHTARLREELVDWAKGEVSRWPGREGEDTDERQGTFTLNESADRSPLELTRLGRAWRAVREEDEEGPPGLNEPFDEPLDNPTAEPGCVSPPHFVRSSAISARAMQVHNRYLIAESDDGVIIVDQHALHERILYEHLRQRILSGEVETQALLVPEPVDLAAAEAAAAVEHRELLAQLGMTIEPFGGDTILVTGYPAMLANLNPADVLRMLLTELVDEGREPTRRDLLDDLMHGIACKAAIKAGDRLSPEEVEALLEQRHLVSDPHHCPHGRPAALVFSRDELDKQFKRL
ncbi:MAG: DNA mismatch repair endonuclease MutL [Pirellulales bacterium]|nr:DNA mismatch repair endonuclease MutL [Pirellulales bacterium]